jgi:5'-3' exonuclease
LKQINLIIDLNILFYRIAFRVSSSGNSIRTELQSKNFINEVQNELTKIIKPLEKFSKRIMFVRDSKNSWRNSIDPVNVQYKGKRNKDYKFDIDNFRTLFNEYFEILKNKNFYAYEVDYLEGDDLLFIISEIFYNSGESSILGTQDQDSCQSIKGDNEKFICVFNDMTKTFYFHKELKKIEDDSVESFFALEESVIDLINQRFMIRNPKKVLFCKMLSGDDSDNVPSAFKYKTNGEGKSFSFTELRAENFYNANESICNEFIDGKITTEIISEHIFKWCVDNKIIKKEFNETLIPDICDGIIRNSKYVETSFKHYSEFLNAIINNQLIKSNLTSKDFYLQHSNNRCNFANLLEGTKYYEEVKAFKTFDEYNKR